MVWTAERQNSCRETIRKVHSDPVLFKEFKDNRYTKTFALQQSIELTDYQEQVILGTLLGDGCIRSGCRNPNLQIKHSINQREYVLWKYSILSNLCRSEPKIEQGSGFGTGHEMFRFQTRCLPCLKNIYDLVKDKNGRKTVTAEWVNAIYHPIGLTLWYLDDGSLSTKQYKTGKISSTNMTLALGDRNEQECEILVDYMKTKWNISSQIYRNSSITREKYRNIKYAVLMITKRSEMFKLKELIEPYVIPSMQYKINVV